MTRYTITKPTFKLHYDITCSDTGHQYFADIRGRPKSGAPNLIVYSGIDKAGPVAGYIHYPAFTLSWKVAFCAKNGSDILEWEDMICVKHSHAAKWRWSVTASAPDGEPERRTFVWTRTRHVGIDGSKPTGWTNRHWKLHEETAGGQHDEDRETHYVALFTGDSGKGKCGTLEIKEPLGEVLEEKLLVALLGLNERTRRSGG